MIDYLRMLFGLIIGIGIVQELGRIAAILQKILEKLSG